MSVRGERSHKHFKEVRTIGEAAQAATYGFNIHALATAAAVVLVVGIATLIREARSPAALPFTLIAAAMFLWMVGSTMMYLSVSPVAVDF